MACWEFEEFTMHLGAVIIDHHYHYEAFGISKCYSNVFITQNRNCLQPTNLSFPWDLQLQTIESKNDKRRNQERKCGKDLSMTHFAQNCPCLVVSFKEIRIIFELISKFKLILQYNNGRLIFHESPCVFERIYDLKAANSTFIHHFSDCCTAYPAHGTTSPTKPINQLNYASIFRNFIPLFGEPCVFGIVRRLGN